MNWTFILFGDMTEATYRSIDLLLQHGIRFNLSLYHDLSTTPALSTPDGFVRGYDNIERFVHRF